MKKTIRTTVAIMALIGASAPRANADPFPDSDAWRARLVTLAPVCKSKDEAWAGQFLQAIALEVRSKYYAYRRISGDEDPTTDQYEAANGHVAMAEHIGGRLFERYGAAACKIFANEESLAAADEILTRVGPHVKQTIIDATGHPYGIPDEAFNAAEMEETVGAANADECKLRSDGFLEKAYKTLILQVGDTATAGAASQEDKDHRWNTANGALDMAFYAGGREAFLMPKQVCPFVKASADLKRIDGLVREERLHPNKWMERLKVPE